MMGKQQALEGDICLCKCDPPPVCLASPGTTWWHTFEAHELGDGTASSTRASVYDAAAASLPDAYASGYGGSASASTADEEDEAPYPAPGATNAAASDCSYLDGTKSRIDAPASFYKHTNAVTISPGKPVSHVFDGGGMRPAMEYNATINGHPLSVFTPLQSAPPGFGIVDSDTITKALETIPSQQYQNLDSVSVNPASNPEDQYWQKKYNDPDFHAGATGSIEKGINFYPWKGWNAIPQQYIDSTMLHESGHLFSQKLWGDEALKQEWLDAMANDGQAPSDYARNNANEDFAESANMYWSSKGTPCEAEGRRRYPARYRYFDSIMK